MGYMKEIIPKIVHYRLARLGLVSPGMPLNFTFSVTNVCQSKCRTCNIWEIYKKNPEKRQEELKIEEIERIFRSMGHVYIFNVSGGEPFLRPDIVGIIELACKYLTPGVIHIPTNAIAIDKTEILVVEILKSVQDIAPSTQVTIKPSLDHIGEKHDDIRGVKGNFNKVMTLFNRLKEIQLEYPNLHAELGTVISLWNVEDVEEIASFVTGLGVDSYRNEIAEQRSEMFNMGNAITPSPEEYENAINLFISHVKTSMRDRKSFQKTTNAFRLVYYDLAIRILKQKTQVITCYAGISNVHMSPYGDVWACCTLGYEKSMGNIRDYGYDFQTIWNGEQAKKVREYIRKGNCHCPLANQAYSNILLHGPSLLNVIRNIF
jgi:MoaA/NifB/PqqE/SkfB family radical SAM enzyme